MKTKHYEYTTDGFEAVLYDAENGDDRLLIVIQGLKGLELPAKYAEMFAGKGYSALAMSYYGGEGQPSAMRAIPLEQFRTACEVMKLYESGRFRRFGIYGNSKGAGIALLAASAVPDISLVIAASSFGHIMQGNGGKNLSPCKAMVSLDGKDFPYVPNKGVFGAFVKRCVSRCRPRCWRDVYSSPKKRKIRRKAEQERSSIHCRNGAARHHRADTADDRDKHRHLRERVLAR